MSEKHLKAFLLLVSCFYLFAVGFIARADVKVRPRAISDVRAFHILTEVPTGYVDGAKVAYVNWPAMRRDFPYLRDKSDEEIAEWILAEFAYVSMVQAELGDLRNSLIPFSVQRKNAYRPEMSRRVDIMEARDSSGHVVALVDRKGVGLCSEGLYHHKRIVREALADGMTLIDVRDKDHSDGLMSFGESIAELTRQQATQILMDEYNRENGTQFQTVESYFIIALPFQILKANGSSIQAAIYGRQAHIGRDNTGSWVDDHGFEMRKKVSGFQWDYFDAAVDYGNVKINDKRLYSGFGTWTSGKFNSQMSRAWQRGHEVAREFSGGDVWAVYRHLNQEMLGPIDSASALQTERPNSDSTFLNELIGWLQSRLDPKISLPERLYGVRVLTRLITSEWRGRGEMQSIIFELLQDKSHLIVEKTLPALWWLGEELKSQVLELLLAGPLDGKRLRMQLIDRMPIGDRMGLFAMAKIVADARIQDWELLESTYGHLRIAQRRLEKAEFLRLYRPIIGLVARHKSQILRPQIEQLLRDMNVNPKIFLGSQGATASSPPRMISCRRLLLDEN